METNPVILPANQSVRDKDFPKTPISPYHHAMDEKNIIADKDTDEIIWKKCHSNDLWVFDKLILSRVLGYTCGPTGLPVPKPDFYCVRPISNFLGMGRNARIEWVDESTEHFHPAEFWCEVFRGDHLSVDFYKKESQLVVLGEREKNSPLYRWKKWSKIDKKIGFPPILSSLTGNYDWINCEFIGDNLIEVHFRQNPNFLYENTEAIPIWDDLPQEKYAKYKFIESKKFLRKGFYVK
jgi:hypothetical protein